jgi:hypothetical protein
MIRPGNGAVCLTLDGAALEFAPFCDDAAVDLDGTVANCDPANGAQRSQWSRC